MRLTREELQKGLDAIPEFKKQFETIDDLLDGDIDLGVYYCEGLDIEIDEIGVEFDARHLKYIEKISALDNVDHMELYSKYGLFHDGGDDFDYGGTFVSCLVDIIRKAIELKEEVI